MVSSSRDHTIKMWDTSTGFCTTTLKAHTNWVKRVTVNKRGTLMASSSKDESIIVWNMDRLKSANQNDAIISVLQEHQNIIDCVKWASQEACSTINNADYNTKQIAMMSSDEP